MKKKSEGINIKELLGIFVSKLWLIIAVALLFALALGIYSSFIKKDTYSSESMIMVTKETNVGVSESDLDLTSRMVETYKNVITTDDFLSNVITSIKEYIANTPAYADHQAWAEGLVPGSIKSSITITQQGETELFVVKVTTGDADKSYIIANVLSLEIERNLSGFLPYNDKDIASKIINTAKHVGTPNSKHEWRNALIGFLVGAVVAMICVFVFNIFDVVIHDRKKIEDNFDIPIIGVIPRIDAPTNHEQGGQK